MELPQYFDGHVVRDGASWEAVVTLTPGGMDCFAAPDFKPAWRHFNHPPNLCSALWRGADAVPAVVVGRADGFVCRYAIDDGTQPTGSSSAATCGPWPPGALGSRPAARTVSCCSMNSAA